MEQLQELTKNKLVMGVATATLSSDGDDLSKKRSNPLLGDGMPKKVCRLDAPRSKSTRATRLPDLAIKAPKLAAMKLLPTPPLPPPMG